MLLVLEFRSAIAQTKDAPLKETPPDVPDAIQVPAGEEVVLYAHATGSQIYACQAAADGKFSCNSQSARLLERIATAAGLPLAAIAGRDSDALADEFGAALGATVRHLAQMLAIARRDRSR